MQVEINFPVCFPIYWQPDYICQLPHANETQLSHLICAQHINLSSSTNKFKI